MPVVYVTCGVAFSGKSTLARRLAVQSGATLIRLDDINAERGFDGGAVDDDRQWELTSFIALGRLCDVLTRGGDAIVDDTFSHRFLRERFRRIAEAWRAGFVILELRTSPKVIAARRAANARTQRRQSVEDAIFARHVARFQWPAPEERAVVLNDEVDIARWLATSMRAVVGVPRRG